MSIRRGYWFYSESYGDYGGPYTTISEAKEEASRHVPTGEVTIRTFTTLEARNEQGDWVTVH